MSQTEEKPPVVCEAWGDVWKSKLESSIEDTNDCSVKALAVLGKMPYSTAHAHMMAAGRIIGKGTMWYVTEDSYKAAGLVLHPESDIHMGVSLKKVHTLLEPNKRYLIHVHKHALAFVDGKVEDYSKGTRKVVEGVWQVLPEGVERDPVPTQLILNRKKVKARSIAAKHRIPQTGQSRIVWDYLDAEYGPNTYQMDAFDRSEIEYYMSRNEDIDFGLTRSIISRWCAVHNIHVDRHRYI